jgi:hypothetical protein
VTLVAFTSRREFSERSKPYPRQPRRKSDEARRLQALPLRPIWPSVGGCIRSLTAFEQTIVQRPPAFSSVAVLQRNCREIVAHVATSNGNSLPKGRHESAVGRQVVGSLTEELATLRLQDQRKSASEVRLDQKARKKAGSKANAQGRKGRSFHTLCTCRAS